MPQDQISAARARLRDAAELRQDSWVLQRDERLPSELPLLRVAQAKDDQIPAHLSLVDALGTLAAADRAPRLPADLLRAARTLDRIAKAVRSPDPGEVRPVGERLDDLDFADADAALSRITLWVAERMPDGVGLWEESAAEEAPGPG
jgi:hypothetical protein